MSVNFSKFTKKRWAVSLVAAIGLIAWVTIGFFGAQVLVVSGWIALLSLVPELSGLGEAVTNFIIMALVYILTLAIVAGGALVARHRASRSELGMDKSLSWLDLLLAPATFVGYLIVSSVIIAIVSRLVPGFDLQEAQEIGFDNIAGQADLFIVFVALVIVAPIAEEILFRGYLFGKLRKYSSFIIAALLTSVVFGMFHLRLEGSIGDLTVSQWNVAIDTFVLSLAMCGLREVTGSIWAGTLVHMLKNGLAFFLLFIYPVLGV